MANLKDIKRRIGSVKSTQKITNAMKLVSAAKFARANSAVEASKPYSDAFQGMVKRLISAQKGQQLISPLLSHKREEKVLLVLMATDRGLCGGLNTTLFKAAQNFLDKADADGINVDVFAGGRKAISFSKNLSQSVVSKREKLLEKPTVDTARELATGWLKVFTEGSYQSVYILYPEFKTALEQIAKIEKILPITMDEADETLDESSDVIVEPQLSDFLDSILEKKLVGGIYHALLNGCASEHGARMTAMDSATNNAQEVIKKLTLQYNRARQAAITTELTEIISGAEALN